MLLLLRREHAAASFTRRQERVLRGFVCERRYSFVIGRDQTVRMSEFHYRISAIVVFYRRFQPAAAAAVNVFGLLCQPVKSFRGDVARH